MTKKTRSATDPVRSIGIAFLIWFAAVGVGCEERSETSTVAVVPAPVVAKRLPGPASDPKNRWTRRFLPYQKHWMRLSEAPSEPQDFPQMAIWEVSQYLPNSKPTDEQRQVADAFVESCFESAERHGWFDYDQGIADGFTLVDGDRLHFANKEFHFDDRVLDPDRPEFLMYYQTSEDTYELAGFMFFVKNSDDNGPQIGGPLTVWHTHVYNNKRCFLRNGIFGFKHSDDGYCETGEGFYRSGEMIHTWLIDHPKGPFATSMYLKLSLVAEKVALRKKERGY